MEKILKSDIASMGALNVYYLSNLLNYTQKIVERETMELILRFLPAQVMESIIKEIFKIVPERNVSEAVFEALPHRPWIQCGSNFRQLLGYLLNRLFLAIRSMASHHLV